MLLDVGLKGNEEKPLVNSYAIFSGLKFKTTSYNHEGAPFFIVIVIYQGALSDAKDLKFYTLDKVIEEAKKLYPTDGKDEYTESEEDS